MSAGQISWNRCSSCSPGMNQTCICPHGVGALVQTYCSSHLLYIQDRYLYLVYVQQNLWKLLALATELYPTVFRNLNTDSTDVVFHGPFWMIWGTLSTVLMTQVHIVNSPSGIMQQHKSSSPQLCVVCSFIFEWKSTAYLRLQCLAMF